MVDRNELAYDYDNEDDGGEGWDDYEMDGDDGNAEPQELTYEEIAQQIENDFYEGEGIMTENLQEALELF